MSNCLNSSCSIKVSIVNFIVIDLWFAQRSLIEFLAYRNGSACNVVQKNVPKSVYKFKVYEC